MENELSAAQNAAYDYRRCARVWQRVDPTLNPYPDVRATAAMAADVAVSLRVCRPGRFITDVWPGLSRARLQRRR